MQQVLFHIPIYWFGDQGIPIYGYGFMLFVAFVLCTWLACRLGAREGIPPQRIQDLAIWLFLSGIAGARITYMIQYGVPFWQFFMIWEGGLVVYGAVPGGILGYLLAYFLMLRKYGISHWKMADIIAPCFALGLCLGRFGCLLNGCCYGNAACPDCPGYCFPPPAPPYGPLVKERYQTLAGFTLKRDGMVVQQVEPNSPAWNAGLRPGDLITRFTTDKEYPAFRLDSPGLLQTWPRGHNSLALTVKHQDATQETTLPPFVPRTIRLHPTQIYESISMAILFFLLMAYYPLRRHDGEVMVLFMAGYAVHRFLDEILRADTEPVLLNMTLSQNGSIVLLVAALVLGLILWRRPVRYRPAT
jgi:phosphatidylglycerol---prolipoprotein diacylglyceryl transferase